MTRGEGSGMRWLVARLCLAVLGRLPLRGRRLRALRRRLELARLHREDMASWRVEKARDLGVKVGTGCRFFSLNFQSEPYLIEIGDDVYKLRKFVGLNERTCQNQKPIVLPGQKIEKGQVIADGAGTHQGELALGRNVLAAFMAWDGFNFEDAIIISE